MNEVIFSYIQFWDYKMNNFDFSDIGVSSLSLELKCSKCGSTTTTKNLPIPDYQIDLDNLDFRSEKEYCHKCRCGNTFSILLSCGLYSNSGYVIDENIKEEIKCKVYEIPDIPYDQFVVFIDTIDSLREIRLIANNLDLYKEHIDYINRLLLINLVTIMDTFIKVSVEPIIFMRDVFIDRYINVFCKGKRDVSSKEKQDAIKSHLQTASFQTKENQNKLFKEVLKIDIEMSNDIEQYVKVRDILIHRNGINPNGSVCKFSKEAILKATDMFDDYLLNTIYVKLNQITTEIIVQRHLDKMNNL